MSHNWRALTCTALAALGGWLSLGMMPASATTSDPTALAVAEDQRVLHASHVAVRHQVPFLVPGRVATLVLPGRPSPYRLPELARRAPLGIQLSQGRATVAVAVLAMPGSTLVLDSHDASTIVLTGGPRYVSIVGLRASILIRGHKDARLHLTSSGTRPASGVRPYVAARGGTMQVDQADMSELGFGLGRTSGVAWLGSSAAVHGGAVASTFLHNHNGAYAARAPGLRFSRDIFSNNEAYGLELYDGTSRVVVNDSRADANGRHGFLVSRGSADVVLRRDGANDNHGDGFVVDDGLGGSTGGALLPSRSSDRTLLTDVSAQRNAAVGIAVNGGSGTVVRDANLVGGRFGVAVEHRARATTLDAIVASGFTNAGLLLDGVSSTEIRHASTRGGKVGLLVRNSTTTSVAGLRVEDARLFAVRFLGRVTGSKLDAALLAGRGPRAIDQRSVVGARAQLGRQVATGGWVTSYQFSFQRWVSQHPTAWSWAPIVGLPLALRLLLLRSGRRGRFVLGQFPEEEVIADEDAVVQSGRSVPAPRRGSGVLEPADLTGSQVVMRQLTPRGAVRAGVDPVGASGRRAVRSPG